MVEFNSKELVLAKQIVNDKFAVGAFSGMIFNAVVSNPELTVEEAIKKALEVRLTLMNIGESV